MAEPKIYTRNYVDAACTFTSSHGDTFISRIYDRDRDSQWISSGANSDATEVTLEVAFIEAGASISRTISRIILINHNLKAPILEYWDGDSWENLATGVALTTSHNIFTFNSVTTTKIRIRTSTTQTTNEEKEIGELVACALTLDIGKDFSNYQVSSRQEASEIKLADGSIHRTVVKHSLNRSEKYEARVTFQLITTSVLDSLRRIKESGAAFLWHPESEQRIDELYYVNWIGQFSWKYMSTVKGAGFQVDLNLKEV